MKLLSSKRDFFSRVLLIIWKISVRRTQINSITKIIVVLVFQISRSGRFAISGQRYTKLDEKVDFPIWGRVFEKADFSVNSSN